MLKGNIRGLKQLRQEEDGQTLVLAAVCFAVLVAFLGMAIDIGHLRYARHHLQLAADAAALAAGLEIRVCAAANPCSTMATAAQSSLLENGFTAASVVYNCATLPSSALVISLNTPPCALGSADGNNGKSGYLEVQLQQRIPSYFARVIGMQTFTVSARAEVRHAGGPCVYALDPSGAKAISITASLTSSCSIVDESNNTNAFSCSAGTVSAPQITIAGGAGALLCSTSPAARTAAPLPTPADPLKYVTAPTLPACGTSTGSPYHGYNSALLPLTIAANATVVLWPDKAYCGGITIAAGAGVTFMPGTYVIKSTSATTGGISISLLAKVTGAGVTIYNFGPYGGLSMTGTGTSNVVMSAPTSGTYSGFLYFQDPGNTTASTVSASSSGTVLQGGFYLPSATFSYALATPSPYTMLVAKDISFLAALTLKGDFSSLTNGSPLNADNVQLVE